MPNHPPLKKIIIRAKRRGSQYFKENALAYLEGTCGKYFLVLVDIEEYFHLVSVSVLLNISSQSETWLTCFYFSFELG